MGRATSSWLLEEQTHSEQLETDCGQQNHQLLTHLHTLLIHFKRTECILLKRSASAFSLLAQITWDHSGRILLGCMIKSDTLDSHNVRELSLEMGASRLLTPQPSDGFHYLYCSFQ